MKGNENETKQSFHNADEKGRHICTTRQETRRRYADLSDDGRGATSNHPETRIVIWSMTFLLESAIAATLVCATSPPRRERPNYQTQCIQYVSEADQGNIQRFQILSGTSLEERMEIEIRDIDGVSSVQVARAEGAVDVNVYLDSFEFELFDKVVQKELSLCEEYPEIRFYFNILPKSAMDAEASVRHAA